MAVWRRWVFELRAPADEFQRLFERALVLRGVRVEPAARFDLMARGFGCRAWVKVEWDDAGLALTAKLKPGLFSSPAALEKLLLEAGREAQTKLTFESGAVT